MKKRLLSLLLVLAVVFSFSLSAFATDTGIDIILSCAVGIIILVFTVVLNGSSM